MKKLHLVIILFLGLNSLTLSASNLFDEGKWKELIALRLELLKKGKFNEAMNVFDEMADYAENNALIDSAARVRRDKISILYNFQQDSILIAEAPIQMSWMERNEQWTHYYSIWRIRCESLYFSHRPQTALHEAQKMLEHAQQRKDDIGRADAYMVMGFIYIEIDNDEAIKAYKHSLQLLKEQNSDVYVDLNRAYGYLCEALENKKDYAEELKYSNEWHQLLDNWKNTRSEGDMHRIYTELHIQKASALIGLSRLNEANTELDEADKLINFTKDKYSKYQSLVRRAQVAYKNGDIKLATKLSDEYAPMMESDDWEPARIIRADILLKANRAEDASRIYRSLYIHKDSTFSRDMRLQLDELNTILRVDELEIKGKLQRSQFIIGIIALFLLGMLIFAFFRYRAAKRLEVAHKDLQKAYEQLEETTTAKERIESELRIARDIQMSMVPSIFPEREGLDLYASMTPAREVGGDLYDYLLEEDTLYFCLGDVSGKGVPASLFMAQATRLFRALAKQHQMPATIATRLNEELTEKNDNGMFVTMFIGQMNLTTGHLYFCNAGHNPPVIGGDEQHGSFLEMESNAPIGLWPGIEYIGEEIETIKGRPLFIYSDGLNEAENKNKEQFGDERMLDILRHTDFKSARQVVETLKKEVEHHRDGAEANDDLTIMCIRA